MNKEIIVFSCNIDNYDKIREPKFNDPKVSYLLFTDNKNIRYKVWKPIYIDSHKIDSDPQRVARYIKTHPHDLLPPTYKISVWIDSCYEICIKNFNLFIALNLFNDISLFHHPKRTNIYDEFEVCKSGQLDFSSLITNQKEKYLKEGLPETIGLYHTAVILRKNNKIIENLNNLWWKEIQMNSKRDQLSFSYCLWKLGIKADIINREFGINLYKSPYFEKYKHIRGRKKYV